MQWWIGTHRFVKTLHFALFIEKTVLMVFCDKKIKLEVAPRELHAARYGCPLAEGDGLVLSGAIGQCIAADDILLQHVSEAFVILVKKR